MNAILLLSMLVTPTHSAEPLPRVRVEMTPKDEAWVGQRVKLTITLFTPDLFAGVPSFDIPTIPGELFAKFQTSFYADPTDAVFKALGVQ